MKVIYKILLFTLLCVFNSQNIQASHMMGSDISYQCISPGKYKLIFKVYRDCRGIPLNDPIINVFCNNVNAIALPNTRTAINDVSERCIGTAGPCNPINSPASEGIEEHVFEATIDFNKSPYNAFKQAGCCEIYFSVEQCCRNGAITTINTGNLYTEAMLNICNVAKTTKKCNTSPTLTIPPVAKICCNQCFTFNNGVTENADGDSLVFSLVSALNGHGSNESYVSPLTPKIPMTPFCPPNPGVINCKPLSNAKPCRGFYFDELTGDIIFTPTDCNQVGVIVIQIDEYRKDSATQKMILVGRTRRDMQLVVKQCPSNNPPKIVSKKYNESVCEGDLIEIDIETFDEPFLPNQTRLDTVTLTWNFGIPGGSLKIIDPKAREKKGKFIWQTKIGDARPSPYRFVAIAVDDNCENPAKTVKGYTIIVKPKAKAFRKFDILECGKLKFESFPLDTTDGEKYTYEWILRDSTNSGLIYKKSFNKKDTVKLKYGGKYIITHKINNPRYNCPKIVQDTVIMPPILNIELAFGKDTFVCAGDSISIFPKINNGKPSFKYEWQMPIGKVYSINEKISIKPTADNTIILKLIDKNKCFDLDTIKVNYQALPTVNIGPDKTICTYQNVILDAQNNDTMRYFWLPSGDSTRTISTSIAGKYIVKVIDKLGCSVKDTINLFVNDTVLIIAKTKHEICIFDTLKIKAYRKPIGYKASFTWKDLTSNTIVSLDSNLKQKIVQNNDRMYEINLIITQNNVSCYAKDSIRLIVNKLPTFKINTIPPLCYKEACINLTLRKPVTAMPGNKDVTYNCDKKSKWVNNEAIQWWCPTKFIPNTVIPKVGISDTIQCCYRDEKGCFNSTKLILKIKPNPLVIIKDKIHCQKAGDIILDSLIVKPFVRIGGIETFKCFEAPSSSGVDIQNIIIPGNYPYSTWKCNVGNEKETNKTGIYMFEYCYKDGVTNCATCDTSKVSVISLPQIEFENMPNQCVNYPLLNLDSLVKEKNSNTYFTNGKWQCIAVNNDRDKSNLKLKNAIQSNHLFNPSTGFGNYLLLYINNSSGCEIKDSVEITVYGLPDIKLQKIDTLCSSETNVKLKSNYPNSNYGKWTGFLVQNNYFLNANKSPKTKQYEGFYISKYTYTNPQTNCTNSDSIKTIVQSKPELNILSQKPFQQCEGTPFILTASKKWISKTLWQTNGDGLFTDKTILNTIYNHGKSDTTTGNVLLTLMSVKEGICPSALDNINLIFHPYPQFNFTGDPLEQCEKAIVNFIANISKPSNLNNLQYLWNFNNSSNQNNSIQNPQNIIFDTAARNGYNISLKIKNKWGVNNTDYCETAIEKLSYVKVWPMPKANFTADPSFFTTIAFPKFQFTNQSKIKFGTLNYLWQFDTKNINDTSTKIHPLHLYKSDTSEYDVSLTAKYNYKISNILNIDDTIGSCVDIKTQKVKIGPDVTVFVPNAFSPNEDGPNKNNVFKSIVNGEKSFEIILFNRWGEILWQTIDKYEGWNGKYKNEDAQQDVYAWAIKVIAYNGKEYKYEGTVTLLR